MNYKGINIYTALEHVEYLKTVEKLNDNEIGSILREYWNCKNMDVASILENYYKEVE